MTDKILFTGEWLQVRLKDGWYEYLHQVKSNGAAVAFLLFHGYQVLGRYEHCPPHGEGLQLSSFTGMVDPGETIEEAVVREIYEEAGIRAVADKLINLGVVRPSKASDTVLHLFAYSVDSLEDVNFKPAGHGTRGEQGAYSKWVTKEEAAYCKDGSVGTMLARLVEKNEPKTS